MIPRKSYNRSIFEKGLSLVEVLMAIAILSIGILAALEIFPTAIQREALAKNNSSGAYIAQGRMEEILGYSYDDPLLAPGTAATSTAGYRVLTTISYTDPLNDLAATTTDTGIKKVDVQVSWGAGTPEQTISISTLYARR